jgi:GNAT superfamily N-acetyltransferase
MPTIVRQATPAILPRYAGIPIRFTAKSVLRIDPIDAGLGGFRLTEVPVQPYIKDYDRDEEASRPVHWAERWDLSNWAVFVAEDEGELAGGATVAWNTEGLDMLEGRTDLACLWDIRVRPDRRGEGIGSELLRAAVEWARQKGCRQFKIETQNRNVPACRFYAKHGAQLGSIHRFGYSGCPAVAHEAMLLWYVDL